VNYPAPQYGQPAQPGYAPQQPYGQPVYQQPAPEQYPPAYPPAPYAQPGFPPQGYGQPPVAPQQPPLANGSIDDFYSQPTGGGGPGVSWKGKPDGYTVQGVVPRDVTNADVSQEVGAPNTQDAGKPLTYRDGRPRFVMAVPLQLPPSHEYPEGEARLFIRGQLREELSRAMGEAGEQGAPKAGAVITVTLVQRKQGRGTIPQNVFAVVYTPAGGQPPAVNQQAPAQPQYGQPVQPMGQPGYAPVQQPQQWAQPVAQQPAPVQQPQYQAPAQGGAPQWAPPAPQQVAQPAQGGQPQFQPQAPGQGQPVPPQGLDAGQQQLLAGLLAAQQQGQPAA
jgi:hypothetical protein